MNKIGFYIIILSLSIFSISVFCNVHAEALEITNERELREISTCDNEKSLFWLVSMAANFTPYTKHSKLTGGEKISFKTSDGVDLTGIKLASNTPSNTYILIIQGNGFPAGRLIQEFEVFQRKGIDVYAFDFRGYKKSGGKRRVWAMLQDYSEILAWLNSKYESRIVYATSFGGVIAANVISDYSSYNLVLLDSVISRASSIFKCDRNYDPVDRLGGDCKSLVIQANTEDRFFLGGYLDELMGSVERCGGTSLTQSGLAHPFEEDKEAIMIRMNRIEGLVEESL